MCGRYVLKASMKDMKTLYGAIPDGTFDFTPIYNVTPTFNMPVVVQPTGSVRIIYTYRWGLVPSWANEINTKYSMINARSETLTNKKTFQRPFQQQRCIVPASGFYEWKKGPDGVKVPYYITLSTGSLMSFAGLYERWRSPEGQTINSFTIITTPASKTMEPLHYRMPALLVSGEFDQWMNPNNTDTNLLSDLLRPYPDDGIKFHPVSPLVNSPRNQGESLIDPK